MMAVTFRVPYTLTESRICGRHAKANPYGAQCYEELSAWLCFKPEVEDWIHLNCKRKSGIRLRPYYSRSDEPEGTFNRRLWWQHDTNGYQVTFINDKDGLLFKLRWIG